MSASFPGYPAPTSNTTYTPNQFFDVVLPNSSRGVVRLVGYMLRKVLGWSDANGNPQQPEVVVSYRELETKAGISHSMIRETLDEAVSQRYIRCLRDGAAHSPGSLAKMGLYELCWDERQVYITNPDEFQGFYAGNGNLTYIPNAFFDHTIPTESLALIKVVGSIIRHTIGFQTKYGFRRQEVEMSFTELQRRTGIASPTALNRAIQGAIAGNHIIRIRDGVFDRNGGKTSQAATYGLCWSDASSAVPSSLKDITPKSVAAPSRHHSEKCSGAITPKSVAGRTEKCSGITPKSVAVHHSEKCSDIEITQENKTSKEQQQAPNLESNVVSAAAVESSSSVGYELLLAAGFDRSAALSIAERFPEERIGRQLEWMPLRSPSKNRLGMLRRAIEENWDSPVATPSVAGVGAGDSSAAQAFVAHYYAGWAGNTEEPATTASAAEVAAAKPFVTRLAKLTAESSGAGGWGRQFAAYSKRESTGAAARPSNNFCYVLKLYGEEFLLKVQRETSRRQRDQETAARQSHQKAHQAAYLAWLGERVGELEILHPEAITAFEEHSRTERAKYVKLFPPQSTMLKTTLEDFDRGDMRLKRLVTFLEKKHPELKLPDFWSWDTEHNPEPYPCEAKSPGASGRSIAGAPTASLQ